VFLLLFCFVVLLYVCCVLCVVCFVICVLWCYGVVLFWCFVICVLWCYVVALFGKNKILEIRKRYLHPHCFVIFGVVRV